ADFDNALKLVPKHLPATIGRAWLDLQSGDADAASKRVNELYNPKSSSPALTTVYAAALRRDPKRRDEARGLLEKLVQTASGADLPRAQLELARIYREVSDYQNARLAYAAAASSGSFDARLEYALLLIDD